MYEQKNGTYEKLAKGLINNYHAKLILTDVKIDEIPSDKIIHFLKQEIATKNNTVLESCRIVKTEQDGPNAIYFFSIVFNDNEAASILLNKKELFA